MDATPRSNRLHIAVYGRRNAGKSSLINFITNQDAALVSDTPGTTADPVLKNMELPPLGPVVFIDTAGIDDIGELGALRVSRTKETVSRTDLALMVFSAASAVSAAPCETTYSSDEPEFEWVEMLRESGVAILGVLSRIDETTEDAARTLKDALEERLGIPFVPVSSKEGRGRAELLDAIVRSSPTDFERETILGDLIEPGGLVVLVAPQDIQAPKGRLILPQVQTLRDILDHGGLGLMCTASGLEKMLDSLKKNPDLVVTDSQIFTQVNTALPPDVPLTSFSILMARYKGDLATFTKGARIIYGLKESDRVLIAEACTHHPLEGDIGRQKLPAWLRAKAGEKLTVDVVCGSDFPENLSRYSLIIHCGACMFTRKQLMSRLIRAGAGNVPITNYGTAIAALGGILERATAIFPEAARE